MCIGLVHHLVLSSQIYDIYQPRERRTRRALLICNTKFKHLRQRDGAEVDVKEMTKLLEGLGYNVECHEDKTSQVKGLLQAQAPGALQRPLCAMEMGGSGTTGTLLSPVAVPPAHSWWLDLHTAGHRWLMPLIPGILQEMTRVMKKFADHKDHLTSDSTFLVFMSHGMSTGICGTKSNGTTDILSFNTIYENFNNKHCRALMGKPKVVIIQCCRGGESLL